MATKRKSTRRARNGAGDVQTQMLNMLHQVWLAGLGAAARAQHGAPKLMEELVAEGAQVHAQTKQAAEKALRGALSGVQETLNARMGKVRGDAADAFENLECRAPARSNRSASGSMRSTPTSTSSRERAKWRRGDAQHAGTALRIRHTSRRC